MLDSDDFLGSYFRRQVQYAWRSTRRKHRKATERERKGREAPRNAQCDNQTVNLRGRNLPEEAQGHVEPVRGYPRDSGSVEHPIPAQANNEPVKRRARRRGEINGQEQAHGRFPRECRAVRANAAARYGLAPNRPIEHRRSAGPQLE